MRFRAIGWAAAAMLAAVAAAAQQATDPVQGTWRGLFTDKAWQNTPLSAKIVADGKGLYRVFVELADKDGKPASALARGAFDGKKFAVDCELDLGAGFGGMCKLTAKGDGAHIAGKFKGKDAPGAFKLDHVYIQPPSLGAKPPANGVELFDGTNLDAWQPTEKPWTIVEGGAMQVGKGNIVSKQEFGDHRLHLEFRTPLMADKRGQARGNSGVYVFGRYEIQVLDSFGLPTADNECGGIYKKAVPKTNACLPPTEWQTYDITFHAPKFDAAGNKTKNAVVRVELNGTVIHDNVELDGTTPGGVSGVEAPMGVLLLQDHHNAVQYRNIWIEPLD